MSDRHDPDVIIPAWLDEGPTSLPPVTRQVLVSSIHLTPQRRRSLIRPPWGNHTMFATPFRLTAAAVVAILLAGSGMLFLLTSTPMPGADAPGAESSPSARAVTRISGTASCTEAVGGTTTVSGGISMTRGATFECTADVNDPRVDGTSTVTWNTSQPTVGASPTLWWGTSEREDADGAWACSWILTDNPRSDSLPVLNVCRGRGGYEGLTYIFEDIMGGGPEGSDDLVFGYIYEGPPPGEWVPASG